VIRIVLWADGSGTTADAAGGWAYVLVATNKDGEVVKRVECSGGVETGGTNNRMELTAVLMGLRALTRRTRLTVRTDSKYVTNAFTENWFAKWDSKQWRKVKNPDLWRELRAEAAKHDVTFEHVPGHTGVLENEHCDYLAGEARRLAAARST
jgi:ribonuclease HI